MTRFLPERAVIFLLLISLLCVIVNAFFFDSVYIGLPLSLLCLFIISLNWGLVLFDGESILTVIPIGLAITLQLVVIFGGILLVFVNFNKIASSILLLVISALPYLLRKHRDCKYAKDIAETDSSIGISITVKEEIILFAYLSMVILCIVLIVVSRKEMTYSIWDALPGDFIIYYLLTALLLVTTVFFTKLNPQIKILMICIFSFTTYLVPFSYALAPLRDPWIDLAKSRIINLEGCVPIYIPSGGSAAAEYNPLGLPIAPALVFMTIRTIGRPILVVFLSRMIGLDVFWVHLLLGPFLYGLILPQISYHIAMRITHDHRPALLASLLAGLFYVQVIAASWHAPNYTGFLFVYIGIFFLVEFISEKHKKYLILGLMSVLASTLMHYLTGVILLEFLFFSVCYVRFRRTSSQIGVFALSLSILPLILNVVKYIYPFSTTFVLPTLNDFQSTSTFLWRLSFGYFYTQTFEENLLSMIFFSLALLGYLKSRKNPEKGSTHRITKFLLLSSLLIEFDYRILDSFMSGVPFGPQRIVTIAYFAYAILSVISLWNLRNVFLGIRIRIIWNHFRKDFSAAILGFMFLSLVLTSNMVQAYSIKSYQGIQPTSSELDVVKFIHENADGEPYVVLCDIRLSVIGASYVGYENPKARYYVASSTDRTLIKMVLNSILSGNFLMADLALANLLNTSNMGHVPIIYIVAERNEKFIEYTNEMLTEFVEPVSMKNISVFEKHITFSTKVYGEIIFTSDTSYYSKSISLGPDGKVYIAYKSKLLFLDEMLKVATEVSEPPNLHYSALFTSKGLLFWGGSGTNAGDLWVSKDCGLTWTMSLDTSEYYLFGVYESVDGSIYCITGNTLKVFKSVDNGITWEEIVNASNLDTYGFSIMVDHFDNIFIGTGYKKAGIFIGADKGIFRQVLSTPDKAVVTIHQQPETGYLFAGTLGPSGIVYCSQDNGETWYTALSNVSYVYDFSFSVEGVVFVATGKGIYYSVDNGKIWTFLPLTGDVNNGAIPYEVTDVYLTPKGDLIALINGGIWVVYSSELYEIMANTSG